MNQSELFTGIGIAVGILVCMVLIAPWISKYWQWVDNLSKEKKS